MKSEKEIFICGKKIFAGNCPKAKGGRIRCSVNGTYGYAEAACKCTTNFDEIKQLISLE